MSVCIHVGTQAPADYMQASIQAPVISMQASTLALAVCM